MSGIPSIGQAAFDYQFSIMQAIKDGVAVQVRAKGAGGWRAYAPPAASFVALNFADFEFRIKPKSREVYINEYGDGSFGSPHPSYYAAARAAEIERGYRRTVKFVEVVDA